MTGQGAIFVRDGAALHLDDAGGDGAPVAFLHGLCGDAGQTAEVFPPRADFRRLTLEARGHGGSEPGPLDRLSIATFAADVAALIEARGLAPAVVGGISMGAAIALRLAVERPDLVRGLILARPAWVTDKAPANMRPNAEVGALLAALPPAQARAAFLAGETARRLASEAPDNLASLVGFFDRAPRDVTAALLQGIATDGPGVSEGDLKAIATPTLVIGHRDDAVHPLAHAAALAALIPGTRLVEITPKARDRYRYLSDFRNALSRFLDELRPGGGSDVKPPLTAES
jgi:pimeloyl-ACP methyl ester carboxylesterase